MGIQLLDKKRNEIVEVASEQSADKLLATGNYERIAPSPAESKPAQKTSTGPELKRELNVSESRRLSVCVWPPGGKYNTRMVTLQESRRDESGKWGNTKILVNGREFESLILPSGAQLLVLSEYLRQAWEHLEG